MIDEMARPNVPGLAALRRRVPGFEAERRQQRHDACQRDLHKSEGDVFQTDRQRRRKRQHNKRQEIQNIVVVAAPQVIGARGEKAHEADEAQADPARVGPQLRDGDRRGRGERERYRTYRIDRENSGRIADIRRKALY